MKRFFLCLVLWLVPAVAAAGQPAVAVLYFRNQGNPELEVFKLGLAEMLASDLDGTPGVRVIERVELQETLNELELGHSGKVDPATAAQIGKLTGARWLLMGSYFEFQGTLRIDARLVEVETGDGAVERVADEFGHGPGGYRAPGCVAPRRVRADDRPAGAQTTSSRARSSA